MSNEIEKWLARAGPTVDAAGEAPRGLYDRLKYIADLIRDAGKLPAEAVLAYRERDGKVCIVPPGRELSVGRELPSNHVVNDPKLSRRHFCVCTRVDRAIISDLHSRNSTYVNGEKVHERELRDGDVIEAGGKVFVFLKRTEDLSRSAQSR